ncbi:membrane protein [Pectobacterium araliae]|uniref:DUF2628 domain-containing protein n=2 Tax=Pectobacterium TaxID=122277 RepID=A0AAE9NTR3_9GAMM|nr:DUF2628 domain-containing protein [Pectobacterium polonicum]BES83768.1 DUF2628 domain-containing protein [Pectobacterium sp. MAFF 302110]GKW20089.1 membrane protein [Pectobacterium carotovorum subsp. carotovorum]MDC9821261.1 DUF2628 domain-containing protein [Pectobacterium polonicum]TKY84071.1 DUF2628 domain-containing protein [Pectobacterium polonicum]UVO09348.1 DUF2628 domain-containing protein [Pectobacterium polonicum]
MENTVGKQYSKKWQTRFSFYNEFGGPKSPAFKDGFKNATFGTKMLLNFNFIAFFFSIIYFFVLGLWRKNLTLFGISVAVGAVFACLEVFANIPLPEYTDNAVRFGLSLMWASTANYAYYLKETQDSKSWNPFEGMF